MEKKDSDGPEIRVTLRGDIVSLGIGVIPLDCILTDTMTQSEIDEAIAKIKADLDALDE